MSDGDLNDLKRLFTGWKGYYKWLALSVLFTSGSVAGSLLIPFLSSTLINQGIIAGNFNYLVDYSIFMLLAAIFAGLCEIGNTAIAVSFSERTVHELRSGAYHQIQELSFSNLDHFRGSDLLVRITTDIQNIKMGIQQGILNLLRAPLMLIVAVVLLYFMAPNLLWIAIVLVIAVTAIQLLYLYAVDIAYDKRQKRYDSLNRVLRESMAGIRVVKAFVRQGLEKDRFQIKAEDLREASLKPQHYYAYLIPSLYMIAYLGIAAVYYFGGIQVLEGTGLNIGEVTAAMQYIILAITPLFILGNIMPFLSSGRASLKRIYELIDAVPDIKENENPVDLDLDNVKGAIKFEEVNFGYPDLGGNTSKMVLKNINLSIKPGETIGFLGATGSGKSTLVNLIPRFYDVTTGKITIDGVNIKDMSLKTLRKMVGTCIQENNIFSGNIEENILLGTPEASYDDMVVAARAADAHGFISAIPEMYEAPVARKGADFSGGQRQRLTIARTLAMKPKILILDDSTSACDVATEARIQQEVGKLMEGSIQIIVAQRISSVITADRIVLLENGQIAGMGNHEDLLASNKLYQEIYESQLGAAQGVAK